MIRAGRRAAAGLAVGLLLLLLPQVVASAAPTDPSQWPADAGLDPELTATSHSVRFAGADRYGTNLAMSLALRGKGAYPFDTSDRTSANAATLSAAGGWWGAGSCPRSIIVVAGDTFADALSAASLSDPTDLGNQPLLRRVAATDRAFDPIGAMDRPDTASAPIVVTQSARDGGSTLSRTAAATAADLARGGCTTAREAIIVGGTRAVPEAVEDELLTLGYREVFRVAGSNRYQTAAAVAVALGTEAPPQDLTSCVDPDETDGTTRVGFYGNAIAEFRTATIDATTKRFKTECRILTRAVVLADGETGADALAAGWWTSRWQVPVLLTGPGGTLPDATRQVLRTMPIDTVIVLGGTARIPESTVDEAIGLATAVKGRVDGVDRYATSVEMAKAFGGWHPGGSFSADMVCVAASAGNGAAAAGWPDALAAGPWCGRLSASGRVSPPRVLASGLTAGGAHPAHEAVPILLVAPRTNTLPQPVVNLLTDASFPLIEQPFAVEFGGQSQISEEVARRLDALLSEDSQPEAVPPTLTEAFATRLDLRPLFTLVGTGARRLCVTPGGATGYRWLAVTRDPGRTSFVFERAATAETAPGRVSAAQCLAYDDTSPLASLTAVAPSSEPSAPMSFDFDAGHGLSLSGELSGTGTVASGDAARQVDVAGSPTGIVVRSSDQGTRVSRAELHVTVGRPNESGLSTFSGTGVLVTTKGRATSSVAGIASTAGQSIELRGLLDSQGPGADRFRGGFRASVSLSSDGGTAAARWLVDGSPV